MIMHKNICDILQTLKKKSNLAKTCASFLASQATTIIDYCSVSMASAVKYNDKEEGDGKTLLLHHYSSFLE